MSTHIYDAAFFAATTFMVGVVLGSFSFSLVSTALIALGVGLYVHKKRDLTLALIVLPSLFLGFSYYNFSDYLRSSGIPRGHTTFKATINSSPDRKEKHQEFSVSLEPPFGGNVYVYANPYPAHKYGDLLKVEGSVHKTEWGRYVLSFPNVDIEKLGNDSSLRSALLVLKSKLIQNIERVLPPTKSALASGILLGERAQFNESLRDALLKSGTIHIVALSGYNISIIGQSIIYVLGNFMKRSAIFLMASTLILLFVLMTGAEPSLVRAATMGILLMLATASGRVRDIRNVITITALFMVLLDPKILVFDISFQLSFLALLGIIYLKPLILRIFRLDKEKWDGKMRKIFLETISAQIAVAPILISINGYISPLSIPANMLILVFMPATMFLIFITATLGFMSGGLSMVSAWLTSMILGYEIFIINLFSLNWL